MVYKKFRINIIFRVLLLCATVFTFFYLLFRTSLYSAIFIIGVLILFQIYIIIRYVEKTNRDLTRFFQSIKYGDFSQTFKDEGFGPSFASLRAALDEVSAAFRKTRTEKEEHYHYLQTVVQHVGIGLIAFSADGEVELINTAAKRLLKVPRLKNIKSLEEFSPKLVKTLLKIKPKQRALVRVEDNNEMLQISLYSTEFKLGTEKYCLVSLQNIQSELEEKELDAWQKLIRVLTHEIMNSITPISSLATTINGMMKESQKVSGSKKITNEETIEDIHQALNTIQKRSEGLLHFVQAYRNLTLIPKPNFQIFRVKEIINRVEKLMKANIDENKIHFTTQVEPPTLELTADPEHLEQVLINILLNALQSVEGQKEARIFLKSNLDERGRILIQVTDNGPGISKDNLDKIFIPFFSTKEGGSGIGLSLSRQIVNINKGSIGVYSMPKKRTTFTLRF
jgi:nitrogen fixation/metabolism regulation signal transduction histidine kinase